ncbi:MAG: hypothetical protein ATN35_12325 [Epulopiscium sp. Nele67-Bin004]|nr:MAG: hypothetical protein ATN35_12325 [Epulopiscium sp. Nele67-Bin004]
MNIAPIEPFNIDPREVTIEQMAIQIIVKEQELLAAREMYEKQLSTMNELMSHLSKQQGTVESAFNDRMIKKTITDVNELQTVMKFIDSQLHQINTVYKAEVVKQAKA